jgi:hypothetical protein
VVDTRSQTTALMLGDGQTVVMGGLRRSEKTVQINQIPLLGDIPIVGYLFRSTNDLVQNSELVILISPHIYRGEPVPETVTQKSQELRDKAPLTGASGAAAQAMAQAEAEAKAKAEAEEAKARAEAEAKLREEARAQARAQAQAEAQAAAEAKALQEARLRAEAQARLEAQAKQEAQAKKWAEAQARARAQAEAEKTEPKVSTSPTTKPKQGKQTMTVSILTEDRPD